MRRTALATLIFIILATSCGDNSSDPTAPPAGPPIDGLTRPIILVPGVAGSQLMLDGQEYWAAVGDQVFSLDDEFLEALALPADGVPVDGSARNGDILRRESIEIIGLPVKEADFYATIIERFAALGYDEGQNLFIFPYDWRIDSAIEAARLRAFIDDVREEANADRVDIVAHSMGGLVTLDALSVAEMDGKVARVVTLGTPVLGATKALGVIEYKAICFTEEILDLHCITNPTTAQRVMRNFPAGYQLLPSREFQHAVGAPLELDGVEASYDAWASIVRRNRNGALLDAASAWQGQLPTRPHDPEVEMLRVVGSDRATPVQLERFAIHDCYFFSADFCPERMVMKVIAGPGDGTVPRASASLHDADRGFDRRDSVVNHYVAGVNHMGLAQDRGVFDVVIAFLGGETEARIASTASTGLVAQAVNDTPTEFEGLTVTVIGPAWGSVYDGNEWTGPVEDAEADIIYTGIPGSRLWRGSNGQTFAFSKPGDYSAEFVVPEPDAPERDYLAAQAAPDEPIENVVLIEIDRYDDTEIEDSAIFRVEPSPGMRVRFDFSTGGDPDDVDILIDRDGDGEADDRATQVEDRVPRIVEATATPSATTVPELRTTPTPTITPTPAPRRVTRQLLQVGPNAELRPDIIEAWEIGEDQSEIALSIEEGLELSDGTQFTSETLLALLERRRADINRFEYLAGEAIDDYTVFILLGTSAATDFLATIGEFRVTTVQR